MCGLCWFLCGCECCAPESIGMPNDDDIVPPRLPYQNTSAFLVPPGAPLPTGLEKIV